MLNKLDMGLMSQNDQLYIIELHCNKAECDKELVTNLKTHMYGRQGPGGY